MFYPIQYDKNGRFNESPCAEYYLSDVCDDNQQLLIVMSVILGFQILILLVYTQITTQSPPSSQPAAQILTGPELTNSSFLKEINNYFGCKTWSSNICTQCSSSYIFNKNGVCCLIDQNCKNYNRQIGVCQLCYEGYTVTGNGSCIQKNVNSNQNQGCSLWNDGKCIKCSIMYYLHSSGVCKKVSDQCRSWNSDGTCTACYYGYDLTKGTCGNSINFPGKQQVYKNPLCRVWRNDTCIQCASRSYFNATGICLQVSDFCQTWDKHDGYCLTCYTGYELQSNSKCVLSPLETYYQTDPGCQVWRDAVCILCSKGWVFGQEGNCVSVSGLCKSSEGLACTSCYKGYTLSEDRCTVTNNFGSPEDTGCKIWDSQTLTCQQCSPSWYLNGARCIKTSDLCKTYNPTNGKCQKCFKGFTLNEGSCVLTPKNTQLVDEGCADWNWDQQICLNCSLYWFMNNGKCHQVSPFCKSYDYDTGICTSCFTGFTLSNNQCQPAPPSNCKTSDSQGCQTCFSGSVPYQKRCVSLSELADIKLYYAQCCPEKLQELKSQGRLAK